MRPIVIGTRGSKLARVQTGSIAAKLSQLHPGLTVDTKVIRTTGDKLTSASLVRLAGETKGLFVKEIEEALMDGSVDLAVHSLKDVPTELPEELTLGLIPRRVDPRDALVSDHPISTLDDLPEGASIGTSSLRRSVQLSAIRPDLKIVPIRGNVDTRIRKMREQSLDGIVLAAAGLQRMDLEHYISYRFSIEEIVPAVGQGSLAIEIRKQDSRVADLVRPLEDSDSRIQIEAERHFLKGMGGGCQVPMGAHLELDAEEAVFSVFLASPDGTTKLRQRFTGKKKDSIRLADQAQEYFISKGAREILKEVKI